MAELQAGLRQVGTDMPAEWLARTADRISHADPASRSSRLRREVASVSRARERLENDHHGIGSTSTVGERPPRNRVDFDIVLSPAPRHGIPRPSPSSGGQRGPEGST